MTKTMTAAEAQAQFFEVLDQAQAGAEIIIKRDDRPVARVLPLPRPRLSDAALRKQRAEAIEGLRRLRKEFAAKNPPLTYEELISARHEGHRY